LVTDIQAADASEPSLPDFHVISEVANSSEPGPALEMVNNPQEAENIINIIIIVIIIIIR
jgi:hypothetical protein